MFTRKIIYETFILFIILILFSLSCSKDPVSPNNPPKINNIKISLGEAQLQPAQFSDIPTSKLLMFECDATDAEEEELSYKWSVNSGSLNKNDSNIVLWTAPDFGIDAEIYVTVSDGTNSVTDTTRLTIVPRPTLKLGKVSPGTGNTDNTFTYEVIYQDPTNNPPNTFVIIIDGIKYNMEKAVGTYSNGASFKFLEQLSKGSHTYHFEFKDFRGNLIRYPVEAYETGPNVTIPGVAISEDVIVVDDLDSISLASISGTTLIYDFTGTPPNIKIGDALASTDTTNGESGYLKKVKSVNIVNGQLVVETDSVTLEDVVENIDFDTTITFSLVGPNQIGQKLGAFRPVYLATGVNVVNGGISLTGVELFKGTYEGSTGTVEISAIISDGQITFTPEIDMGAQIGFFKLKEFHTIIGGILEFPCDFLISTDGAFEKGDEKTIAKFVNYQVYPIGIPVQVKFTLSFIAGYEANILFEGATTFGFEYTNGLPPQKRIRS